MSTVTEVVPQKKNPKRFNVFLDGKFAFGADEDLLVSHRLVPGKILATPDVAKLLFEAEVGKLMERMYNLFSVRQRSEKEVRDYLKNLSFKRKVKDQEEISGLTVDSLVEKLKQKNLIDDLQFAKAWVEARRKSKQKSKRALVNELVTKGIDKEIIDQVLEIGREGEEELAKLALEKKLKSWKNLDKENLQKKAYDFLARRGFNYSTIRLVVENVLEKS